MVPNSLEFPRISEGSLSLENTSEEGYKERGAEVAGVNSLVLEDEKGLTLK
jgi:hypothetical protein